MKRSIRVLLLSLALIFTLIPAVLVSADDETPGPKPVSLTYEGATLTYRAGETWLEDFYKVGNKVTEFFDDGTSKVFICTSYNDTDGEEIHQYFLDGQVTKDAEGYYDAVYFEFEIPESGIPEGTTSITFFRDEYYGDSDIKVKGELQVSEKNKPVAAAFSGKTKEAYVTEKNISMDPLCVAGNTINIAFSDGSTVPYICKKVKEDGGYYTAFYANGVYKKYEELEGNAYVKAGLKKGSNTVSYTLSVTVDNEYYEVPLTVTLNAKKTYVETKDLNITYTGKIVKPKITVKDGLGRKIPAKAYKITYYNAAKKRFVKSPYGKNYGVYEYQITFKKAYKKKYMNPVWGAYAIAPKATAISKVKAGKGKITVSWKKSAEADGYYIEYTANKKFDGFDDKQVKGGKKTSATISGLDEKETYYVRVKTYKKVKTRYLSDVRSKPSKVLNTKTK